MALTSPGGFCHLVRRDPRNTAAMDATPMRRLCVKAAEDDKTLSSSSSSSPSSQQPSRSPSMELSNDTRKWGGDLGPLQKPLSSTGIRDSTDGSNVRVAYQGLPGAFSEVAALKAFPQSETVPFEQFEVVFKAVEDWVVDKAVLPIENAVNGSIHRNYDLLLCHGLHIVGEVQLAVNHCLMALPGVKKADLKRLLSHPQAILQCEAVLNQLSIVRESADSTAAAAQLVSSKNLVDAGAIASRRAAQIYGLNILEKDIQDFTNNVTRFLILAREPIIPTCDRPFKTSIVFTLEEGPGILFKVLAVFALRKINLSKIESRPHKKQPRRVVHDPKYGTFKQFNYLFHVDFEASMADPRARNALSHLQEFVSFFRVLGSYPVDTTGL